MVKGGGGETQIKAVRNRSSLYRDDLPAIKYLNTYHLMLLPTENINWGLKAPRCIGLLFIVKIFISGGWTSVQDIFLLFFSIFHFKLGHALLFL